MSLLSLPLSDHPPPPPSHLYCPSLFRQLRLSLGCFESPPFFCGAGTSQRCGVLHACPVFLLAPSAGNLKEVVRAFGQLMPPSCCLVCSVNPHCLVILFELTWMLLFGFSACGLFKKKIKNIYLSSFVGSESTISCFKQWMSDLTLPVFPSLSQICQ